MFRISIFAMTSVNSRTMRALPAQPLTSKCAISYSVLSLDCNVVAYVEHSKTAPRQTLFYVSFYCFQLSHISRGHIALVTLHW